MKNKKNILLYCLITLVVVGLSVIAINHKNNLLKSKSNLENNLQEEINTNYNKDNIILNVTMESSYKTGNIEELYDDSSVVLIADFVADEKYIINDNGIPNTYSLFKVKKILKNESGKKISDTIYVKRTGGIVTLKQLIDARGEEYAKKMGINNLSKEKIENGLVEFKNNTNLGDKNLTEWKTRLLMLTYNKSDDTFSVMQDDYGMLSYNEKNNTMFDFNTKEYLKHSFLK